MSKEEEARALWAEIRRKPKAEKQAVFDRLRYSDKELFEELLWAQQQERNRRDSRRIDVELQNKKVVGEIREHLTAALDLARFVGAKRLEQKAALKGSVRVLGDDPTMSIWMSRVNPGRAAGKLWLIDKLTESFCSIAPD
jgi:hypothetical protein